MVRYAPSGYDGSIGWSAAAPACRSTVIFLPTEAAAFCKRQETKTVKQVASM